MARKYVDPVITKTPGDRLSDSVETHPAYGQIACSRVTCQPGESLYGSDFKHNGFMTITIRRSELHRGLNRDWPHSRDELIEVALSESQWATFVSTPNSGLGVQCTLQFYRGDKAGLIPGIPAPPVRTEQFHGEARDRIEATTRAVDALVEKIEEMPLSAKAKKELKAQAETISRQLTDGLPWVAKQFAEHVETTTDKARAEIHAYMEQTISRAGLRALAEKAGIPELARGPFDMSDQPALTEAIEPDADDEA